MATIPAPIRRVLRSVTPWRLRDGVRRRRLARQVTTNVDVVVPGKFRAWRWRATTPDSYRVGAVPIGTSRADTIFVPPGDPKGLGPVASGGAQVVAAVNASPPPWVRRGTAAGVEPVALAMAPAALADIAGSSTQPVPALFDRFDQAGHRLTVVPTGRRPLGKQRLDPFGLPAAVVLGAVPLHDVGGGSRGAQLTMELLARGFHVAYVTRFATSVSADLGLRHIHPNLEQYTFDRFDASSYAARARSTERVAICEIPVPEYAAAALDLRNGGFEVIYDLVDNWSDPALGLDWYHDSVEQRVIDASSGLAASAETLIERLSTGRRSATLVPNGVNGRLFTGDAGDEPPDLPKARPLLGYHGSLYGEWLDWEAIAAVAEAFPKGSVVIIGDAQQTPPSMPSNVRFLGAKAQVELPGYVGRYDAGLVPFAVTATTHGVSPLKAFECLAMGVPVAASPLRSLQGIDGVHIADSLPTAVAGALEAAPPDGAAARRAHGWGDRLGLLLGVVGKGLPPLVEPMPRVEPRPVVRYGRRERRLG